MSTRSNVVAVDKKTGHEEVLYRHFDGYLSGAGVDLLKSVSKMREEAKRGKLALDAVNVKKWLLSHEDCYEDASKVSGDVEYIYEVIADGKSLAVRAFDTKMFAGPRDDAVRQNDITAELMEEWHEFCRSHALEDCFCSDSANADDVQRQLRQQASEVADELWRSKFRDILTDAVLSGMTLRAESASSGGMPRWRLA